MDRGSRSACARFRQTGFVLLALGCDSGLQPVKLPAHREDEIAEELQKGYEFKQRLAAPRYRQSGREARW